MTSIDGRVVYCSLPRHRQTAAPTWKVLGIILLFIGTAIACHIFGLDRSATIFISVLIVTMVSVLSSQRRQPPTEEIADRPHALLLSELASQRATSARKIVSPVNWSLVISECNRQDLPLPTTFAATSAQSRLMQIELTEHLLEPESLAQSNPYSNTGSIVLIVFNLLLAVLLLTGDQPLWALPCFGMAAFFLVGIPSVRDRLRGVLPEGDLVIAPGAARDSCNRLWTIDDSIMIVQVNGSVLRVTLTGPAGSILKSFSHDRDREFVRLWQCWHHPQPRPQLLAEMS